MKSLKPRYFQLMVFGLVLLLGISFTGCLKYENGPALSLRSKKSRIANTWKVELYTINGEDKTFAPQKFHYTETYTEDGGYSCRSDVDTATGSWEFQSNKEQIKRYEDGQPLDLVIMKLKENEFWYYYMLDGDRYEFHMVEE